MNIKWRTELPQWLIIAAMFLAAAIIWPTVSGRIPVHWDAHGNVDGYGGKFEGLLLLPLIALGIYALLLFLPRIDPGRANYAQFSGAYLVVRYAVLLLLAGIYAITLLAVKGHEFDTARLVFGAIGILFIVLGNVLGKVRPNWFVGVRTPWTLSSKRSWVRTHRLAGWLFVLAGVIFLGLVFFDAGAALPWIILGVVGVLTIVLVAYSYIEWRNDPEKTPPSGTLPG
ncbi:MAG TPA: SdpI family protein [Nitrolancea sp.]|nr:SdpI family protein [Nitrolancea sp.]